MNALSSTLKGVAQHEVVSSRAARRGIGIAFFVIATTLGAHVAVPVPWTVVPLTLQPMLVVLAGVILGPRLGAAAMASYLALGISGAPVFSAGHGGALWLLGPTGGYLVAYPAAAFVAGWVAGPARGGALRLLAGLTMAYVVIYLGGVSQLMILTGQGVTDTLAIAVTPFLGGDLVKILIAFVIARQARPKSLGYF